MEYLRHVYAEIDLQKIKHNYEIIKKSINPETAVMAVVKADAYGHGAVVVSKELEKSPVDWFGVAFLGEAIELRKGGVTKPILVLGWTPPEDFQFALDYNITLTMFSLNDCNTLSQVALKNSTVASVHIKIDTGMGRLGLLVNEQTENEVLQAFQLKGLNIEGIFTHFAKADEPEADFTARQNQSFIDLIKNLEKKGCRFKYKHAANSAAILAEKDTWFNMVRLGIALYGLTPSTHEKFVNRGLQPALSLKAKVSHVKVVDEGFPVSYSSKFITERKTVLATVPIGYADGYLRKFSAKGKVIIHGQYAPIVGVICMDQFVCDVTDIPEEVKPGDMVILIGEDRGISVTADDLAEQSETINYEILCGISGRVPRFYKYT